MGMDLGEQDFSMNQVYCEQDFPELVWNKVDIWNVRALCERYEYLTGDKTYGIWDSHQKLGPQSLCVLNKGQVYALRLSTDRYKVLCINDGPHMNDMTVRLGWFTILLLDPAPDVIEHSFEHSGLTW